MQMRNQAFAMLASLVLSGTAFAEAPEPPPPVPWALTQTSSTTSVPDAPVTHRVEQRILQKDGRATARVGFSYLSRGDLRTNPGVGIELGWFPLEILSIDFVSATIFMSSLNSTARDLRARTGLLPDSQRPLARITTGGRVSLAYGKLLVETLDLVVHLDAAVFLHGGVLITDVTVNPVGDLGAGLQIGFGERTPPPLFSGGTGASGSVLGRLLLWIDAAWVFGYEQRSASNFTSGPMATLGVGVLL